MSLMGIDIGTTGCKVGAFSNEERCPVMAYREHPTLHPAPGWSELDSRAVMEQLEDAIREVAIATELYPVTSLCVSAMGEAITPVSADGEILGNAILGGDLRGAEHAERMKREIGEEVFYLTRTLPATQK